MNVSHSKPKSQVGMIATVPPPRKPDPATEPVFTSTFVPDDESQATVPPKQEIFNNELVTALCLQFKQSEDFATYQKICAASNNLIDSIIRVHKYHLTAPFEDIKNSMFIQLRQWIRGVKIAPGAPKAYTYFSACVAANSVLYTEDGRKLTIKEIVDNRLQVNVKSRDRKTGKIVYRRVVDWFKRPVEGGYADWKRVRLAGANGTGFHSVFATQDHRWDTDRGEVPTCKLDPKKHGLYITRDRLTEVGKQAVLGMYMGDGNVTPARLFRVSHCEDQSEYSKYVANKLGAVVASRPNYSPVSFSKPDSLSYWYTFDLSRVCPDIASITPSVKKVTRELLDELGAIGLAFWYMDDGYWSPSKGTQVPRILGLCTQSFTREENQIIQDWFVSKYGISFRYTPVKDTSYGLLKLMRQDEILKFMGIVAPYLIPCMQYKVVPKLRLPVCALDGIDFISHVAEVTHNYEVHQVHRRGLAKNGTCLPRIQRGRVTERVDMNWRYDVEVEDTHTFIVDDISSMNCIRNAALSYISKEKQLSDRVMFEHVHQTPLEAFEGTSYTPDFDFELRQTMLDKLRDLEVRWKEPVIREIIKYIVSTVVESKATTRRQQILQTIVLGWKDNNISMETAKFLLDWTQGAVRQCLLEVYDQPLGEIDIMRVADKFSFMPDIVNLIGLPAAKKLMTVFAGITVRFPSHTQLRKLSTLQQVHEAIEKDPSPQSVAKLASKLRTSPDKVQQAYEQVVSNITDGLLTDQRLYEDEDDAPERMMSESFHK